MKKTLSLLELPALIALFCALALFVGLMTAIYGPAMFMACVIGVGLGYALAQIYSLTH
jgi:hypothetical protein